MIPSIIVMLQVQKWVPDLQIEYKVDARQEIADSWPMVQLQGVTIIIARSAVPAYISWSGRLEIDTVWKILRLVLFFAQVFMVFSVISNKDVR